jgi:hypothetical protein
MSLRSLDRRHTCNRGKSCRGSSSRLESKNLRANSCMRSAGSLGSTLVAMVCGVAIMTSCSRSGPCGSKTSGAGDTASPHAQGGPLRTSASDFLDLSVIVASRPGGMLSVSDIVHVVHLMGEAAQLPAPHHDRRAIEVFLDDELSRAVFGSPLLFRSRYGVRYVSPNQVYNRRYLPSGSHNDQVLCTLAQAGVPATRQILCGGDRLSVSDAIQDCLANFDISAPEIEWTAIAIATYLPPRQSWINKLGDRTNFDGLATELMHRNLAGGAAAGRIYWALSSLCALRGICTRG